MLLSVIVNLLAYASVVALAVYVSRQPALSDIQRRNYLAILKLNFFIGTLGLAFYEYCFNGYIWFGGGQQQSDSFFYQFGVTPGDWLGLAVARYLFCSLMVVGISLFIFGFNYLLLLYAKIGQKPQRALSITLGCVILHLLAAGGGCLMFYLKHTRV